MPQNLQRGIFCPMTWSQENSFDRSLLSQFPPSWPNEMLVKVLSSLNYSAIPANLSKPAKVLEVGIFSGNNARFFLENGYKVFGSELNVEMVELGINNLTRLGYTPPQIEIGDNLNLSASDSEFDLLVSINTIHYSSGKNSELALKEFSRVIRKGGYAVIETPGSDHFAVRAAKRKEELSWEWHAGGFREGQSFGFFDTREHFQESLLKHFSEVNICRRIEEYPEVTLEFWMAICRK